MDKLRKQPMVTITIPLEVFDRIFQILGNYSADPDTAHVLSTLYSAYINAKNPGDTPLPSNFWKREWAKKVSEELLQSEVVAIAKDPTTGIDVLGVRKT